MVVIDRLSKRIICVPTHTTASARCIAILYFRNVFRFVGLPLSLISDRDSRFLSRFWTALFSALGSSVRPAGSSHHQQTDGQTERTIRVVERVMLVQRSEDSWLDISWSAEDSTIDGEARDDDRRSRAV